MDRVQPNNTTITGGTLGDAERKHQEHCSAQSKTGGGCEARCTEVSTGTFSCTCVGAECGTAALPNPGGDRPTVIRPSGGGL